jgi:hypothetical protein
MIKLCAHRVINKTVDTPKPRVIPSQAGFIDHDLWLSANWQRFQKGAPMAEASMTVERTSIPVDEVNRPGFHAAVLLAASPVGAPIL